MGTTTTLVTVQEFIALPEAEGERIELIGGEVVRMGGGGIPHELVKSNLIRLLVLWANQDRSLALFSETMFQLGKYDCPIPDVSLLARSRLAEAKKGWFQGAPDVAIEVVSSEKASLLESKIELYFANGSQSVWTVFPEQQRVRVHDRSGDTKKFERNQILEDPALPGFRAPVSEIFEGI